MGFKKEGRKRLRRTRSIKKMPPQGPQINARPFCSQKTWETHGVFRLRWFQMSAHFALVGCFWEALRRPNILKDFLYSEGVAKKPGKKQFFWLSHVRVFFSISSPHDHLSSSYTLLFAIVSFILVFLLLLLCFPFLRWLCFLVSIHLYLCCVHFSFSSLSLLSSLLVWQKPRSNHNISEILIFIFCFGACIPTLSLGPDNNPTRHREESLKMLFGALFLVY